MNVASAPLISVSVIGLLPGAVWPAARVIGAIGIIASMQRIFGGVSEGNEFQHPTGVTCSVALEALKLVSVK